jgi:tRNA G18 (ribose-2'-O)-methylase SpoU
VVDKVKLEDKQEHLADRDQVAEMDILIILHLAVVLYVDKEILADLADRANHREVAADMEAQVEHLADILNMDQDLVIQQTWLVLLQHL